MILGQAQQYASPEEALAHISEAPWSNFSKADYTVEQWHAACLVHVHDGAPTSKSECKLPVKTPDGTLNRNGVHAAAAALAGARGGLKGVSAEQKEKAAKALKRYYSELDEEAPESLAHYGIKGMRWGVRSQRPNSPTSPRRKSTAKKAAIGVEVLTVAARGGFVAMKLAQSGQTPMSAIRQTDTRLKRAQDFIDAAGGDDAAKKYAEMFLKQVK